MWKKSRGIKDGVHWQRSIGKFNFIKEKMNLFILKELSHVEGTTGFRVLPNIMIGSGY